MARLIPSFHFEVEVPLTAKEATRQWEEHVANQAPPFANRFAEAFKELVRNGFGKSIFEPLIGIEVRAGQLIQLCVVTVHLVPKPVMVHRITGFTALLCLFLLFRGLIAGKLSAALSTTIFVAVFAYLITFLFYGIRCSLARRILKRYLNAGVTE